MHTRKGISGCHRARGGRRWWLTGGVAALLLATGGYYASAQGITLHMAGGAGSSGTTVQHVRLGGTPATIQTRTTEPPGDQGFSLNDWQTTGPAAAGGSVPTSRRPVRATPAVAPTAPRSTAPATPRSPTPGTSAPAVSPVGPVTAGRERPARVTLSQIARVLARYRLDGVTDWVPLLTYWAPNGYGGTLTAVVGAPRGDDRSQLIFVWNNRTFLGVTTTQTTWGPDITALPHDGFRVIYSQWSASAWPDRRWVMPSRTQTIRYTWNGVRLVPSYTGPVIPPIAPVRKAVVYSPVPTPAAPSQIRLAWNGPVGNPWGNLCYAVTGSPVQVAITFAVPETVHIMQTGTTAVTTTSVAAGQPLIISSVNAPEIELGTPVPAVDLQVQATGANGAPVSVAGPNNPSEIIHALGFSPPDGC